jgi:hypothetical protein
MPTVHLHIHRTSDAGFEKETRTYKITGPADFLIRFENFLAQVERMGAIGHSGVAGLGVDGDGSDRITVEPKLKLRGKVVERGTYPNGYESMNSQSS